MEKIVVGIDVSKDRLDVAIRPGGACFAVDRTAAGVDDLIAQLKGRDVKLIALEATGGFETVVAAALCAAGFPVVIVNPAQACPREGGDQGFRQGARHSGQACPRAGGEPIRSMPR
jgi:transposase